MRKLLEIVFNKIYLVPKNDYKNITIFDANAFMNQIQDSTENLTEEFTKHEYATFKIHKKKLK